MKRLLSASLALFVSVFLLYAGAPYSERMGNIAVEIKEGSEESIIYKAVKEEYTDLWLEEYTSSPVPFAVAYSQTLSRLLPMEHFLLSESKDGRVKVLDQASNTLVTFIIKEGRITALQAETSSL